MENLDYVGMTEVGLFGAVALFFTAVLVPIIILAYLLFAIGLYKMAQKRKISNPWIAFIPVIQVYTLGELVDPLKFGESKISNTPLVILGAVIASVLLGFIPVIGQLISLASLALIFLALYRLYEMYSDNATLYLILSIIPGVSSILIFILRNKEPKMVMPQKQEK